MKKIYFLSDAHLGSRGVAHPRTQERRLVCFLDQIKDHAAAIYFLGDMFDFWYEYRMVVPKGHTRFLGKLSELTDMGVEVHYFTGNHDLWCGNYLEKECGVILHRNPLACDIYGKLFYLAHGDGLGETRWQARLLFRMFHNRILQAMFSAIHPRWAVDFGLAWAKHSRLKRKDGVEQPFRGDNKEPLVRYTQRYMEKHHDINFFVYGHRHIIWQQQMSQNVRLVILGEWINLFSYAVYDGEHLFLEQFVEGESALR